MKLKYKISLILPIAVVFFGALLVNISSAAGTASLSLSPSSGSYSINTNFTVTVYEDSGLDTVYAVAAYLEYDQAKLQFVSIDTSTSAFNDTGVSYGGNPPYVNIERKKTGSPLTGKQIVGKVTFKALVNSGSSSVTFVGSSILRTPDDINVWNESETGGTYTMTTPAPAPSGSSSPSGGTTSGSSPSAGSTTTSKPSSSTTAKSSPSTATQKDNPAEPVAVNNDPGSSTYSVSVKIVNSKGKPQKGTDVALGSNSAKTDSTGVASFSGIAAGSYKVSVQGGKVMGDSTIIVDGSKSTNQVQQFEVRLKPGLNLPILFKVGGGIALVILIGYFLLHKISPRHMWGKLSGRSSGPEDNPAPTATAFVGSVIQPTVVSPQAGIQQPKPYSPPKTK